MDAAHTFRILLKNYMTPKKSKTKNDIIIEKPSQGIIWVAKTYPPWQSIILETMREMYCVSSINLVCCIINIACTLIFLLFYRKMEINCQTIKFFPQRLPAKQN